MYSYFYYSPPSLKLRRTPLRFIYIGVLRTPKLRKEQRCEPRPGIEPGTSFLPRKRSATELSRHFVVCTPQCKLSYKFTLSERSESKGGPGGIRPVIRLDARSYDLANPPANPYLLRYFGTVLCVERDSNPRSPKARRLQRRAIDRSAIHALTDS